MRWIINRISFDTATQLLLMLYSVFVIFHLVVIILIVVFDIAPVEYLWGGRLKTREELLVFEIISLAIQILCVFFTVIHARIIDIPRLYKTAYIILWILFVLFTLNTIGNLFAKSNLERILFTPITALLALFTLKLVLTKRTS